MSGESPLIQPIFLRSLEIDPAERDAFLDDQCGEDAELRRRVEALLEAHGRTGSFLDSPCTERRPTDETIGTGAIEQEGSLIGPYKLLQQVGEGGMGVVYMAEQIEPVHRRVALKIIKPGMDTRQVIARFEAERQALAMMDHPNIAKVLDVGKTNSGRPFFVMELVRGKPITEYCDDHRFSPRQRLELFVPVCQAVQHAHQKGIIHRDIKPSNVLVAEYDDKPVPKIIDFGVAKAIEQRLTAKTMFTELGQVIGTPDYMSPEQAKLNQRDIDTRSDIYSLGVLLYELLSGNTPFDRQRLRNVAFDELLRIIREEEPPKLSQRLRTAEPLPSIAANRDVEPAELSRQLSGELDWIVLKAMEKDRSRRYETANGLAADLKRYLDDEPVLACPPSAGYRFRKFSQKNRVAIVTFFATSLLLIVISISASMAAVRFHELADERSAALENSEDSLALAREAIEVMHYRSETYWSGNVGTQAISKQDMYAVLARFCEDYVSKTPNSKSSRYARAQALFLLASIFRSMAEDNRAGSTWEKAVKEMESLIEEDPSSTEYSLQLVRCYDSYAMHHSDDDSQAKALELIQKALSLIAKTQRLDDEIGYQVMPAHDQSQLAHRNCTCMGEFRFLESQVRENYGKLLERMNRSEQASSEFEKAIEITSELERDFPDSIRSGCSWRPLASYTTVLVNRGAREAKAYAQRALDRHARLPESVRNSPVGHATRAVLLSQLDQHQAMIFEVEESMRQPPHLATDAFGQVAYLLARRFSEEEFHRFGEERAIELARQCVRLRSDHFSAWRHLYYISHRAGGSEFAFETVESMIHEVHHQKPAVQSAIGFFYFNCPDSLIRDEAKGIEYAEMAWRNDPTNVDLAGNLARYLLLTTDLEQYQPSRVRALADKLKESEPAQFWLLEGIASIRENAFELATDMLKQAKRVGLSPYGKVTAEFHLSMAFAALGDLDKARSHLQIGSDLAKIRERSDEDHYQFSRLPEQQLIAERLVRAALDGTIRTSSLSSVQ